jgi:hypothetical protein
MFKSIVAAGLAAFSILSFSPAASADSSVFLSFGSPRIHYPGYYSNDDGCGWIGHRYHCSGGYVEPHRRVAPHFKRERYAKRRISCGQAADIVRDHGFSRVVATDCGGKHYHFKARKHGDRFFVRVNSRSGAVTFYYR